VRIAFLVNEFPVISETFILDQVTWLLDRGCEVDIYAQRMLAQNAAHPEVAAYSLMDRAFQLLPPLAPSKLVYLARAVRDVALALPKNPGAVARAFSPTWFGTEAFHLTPFYRVLPFLGRPAYDVVHCHFGPNGLLGIQLRDLGVVRAPILTQFWGYDVSSYVRSKGEGVYQRLFAKGDLFLGCSERMRARIVELGCDAHKTGVQYAGVAARNIPFVLRNPGEGETIRLLTVGRLVEKKGIEFGLRAVARLIDEYPKVAYTIVGAGPEYDALTALSRELGIGSHVNFVGAKTRETVAALMRDAHILLAPSVTAASGDEEGIPVVLMEALALGLPVVSTTNAGIPELVSHRVSGMLAPERDPAALADHVSFLLTHPDERRSMAQAGRRTIETDFDIDKLNAQLFEQYEKISRARAKW
jgi:colanic acid/amylovoran biosynthesis glycosyltransferase